MATIKKISPLQLWDLAHTVISNPAQWARGACARNEKGHTVDATNPHAKCWCSGGVLRMLTSGRPPMAVMQADFVLRDALDLAARAIEPKITARVRPFVSFNDTHKHAEVMQMWQQAREILLLRKW